MNILTKYENNNGSTENCLEASGETLDARKVGCYRSRNCYLLVDESFGMSQVDFVDIAMDACAPHHYKESEDMANFTSTKT